MCEPSPLVGGLPGVWSLWWLAVDPAAHTEGQSARHAISSGEGAVTRPTVGALAEPTPKIFWNLAFCQRSKTHCIFARPSMSRVEVDYLPNTKSLSGNCFYWLTTETYYVSVDRRTTYLSTYLHEWAMSFRSSSPYPVWSQSRSSHTGIGYQSYPIEDSVLSFKYLSSTKPLPSCPMLLYVPANMLVWVVPLISQCCSFQKLLRLFWKACHRTRGW